MNRPGWWTLNLIMCWNVKLGGPLGTSLILHFDWGFLLLYYCSLIKHKQSKQVFNFWIGLQMQNFIQSTKYINSYSSRCEVQPQRQWIRRELVCCFHTPCDYSCGACLGLSLSGHSLTPWKRMLDNCVRNNLDVVTALGLPAG